MWPGKREGVLAVVLSRERRRDQRPLAGPTWRQPLQVLTELHQRPGGGPERVLVELLLLPGGLTLLVDVLRVVAVQLGAGALQPLVRLRPRHPQLAGGVENLQALTDHRPEHSSLVVVGEVEAEDLFAGPVPPLVEVGRGLIVPHASPEAAVEHHLTGGQSHGHHAEGEILEMVQQIDVAHGVCVVAGRNPFLSCLVIQHHVGSGSGDAQLQLHVVEGRRRCEQRYGDTQTAMALQFSTLILTY